MRSLVAILSLCFLLGCELPGQTDEVQYRVTLTNGVKQEFSVTYTSNHGQVRSVGPISDSEWQSSVHEFEEGTFVQLEITRKSGNGAYKLQIWRNGDLDRETALALPENRKSLEVTL